MARRVAALLAVAGLAITVPARAQEVGGADNALLAGRKSDAWEHGETRAFVGVNTEVGAPYLRPRAIFGWGKPYYRFIGVDLSAMANATSAAGYGGVRFVIPHVALRVGGRVVTSFQRTFFEPKDSYGALDLAGTAGDKARYVTLESELAAAVPVGPGSLLALFSAFELERVQGDQRVYEETLRVVAARRWLLRARLGWVATLGREGNATAGVVAEVLDVPGRPALVVRAGIVATFAINAHLEALLTIVPAITGPDTIGIAGGDISQIGLRYRWATGP